MSILTLPLEVLENLLLYIGKEDLFNILEVLRVHGSQSLWKHLCKINGYKALANQCWKSTYQSNLNWKAMNFLKIPGTKCTRVMIVGDFGPHVDELDFHYRKNYIYLACSTRGCIIRVTRRMCTGEALPGFEVIVASGYVYGIAVDWINNKIYWNNAYDLICMMADLDGDNQQTIINSFDIKKLPGLANIEYMYDVHVDPLVNLLFMIVGNKEDRGTGALTGRMIKSDLTGQNPRALEPIKHDGKEVLARTIAVDVHKKRIYGSGRSGKQLVFYSCDYSGRDVDMIFIDNNDWAFPMSVSSNCIYFALKNRTVDRVFKIDMESLKTKNINMQKVHILGQIRDVHEIKVIDYTNQCLNEESALRIMECSKEDCKGCCLKSGESICKMYFDHCDLRYL